VVSRFYCYMDGRTLRIFGAAKFRSSSRRGSAPSHRTSVASGAPIGRKESPRIPCRTRSRCARHPRRARYRRSGHCCSRLGSLCGMVDGYRPPESRSQACRSFGATSTCATHVAAAGDGLVPAVFPVRRNCGGVAARDNWALLREILRGNGDIDRYMCRICYGQVP
jgi:hypothetical protein